MANNLLIDQITRNMTNRVLLTYRGVNGTYYQPVGYMAGPLMIGGSADWTVPTDTMEMVNKVINEVKQGVKNLGSTVGWETNFQAKQESLRLHQNSTLVSWGNSSKPSFSCQFTFIKIKDTDNPVKDALDLFHGVYPSKNGNTLTAPLGYGIDSRGNPTGTVSMYIGGWFYAPDLVFKQVGDFEYSEQPADSTGSPLYVTGPVTLEPVRESTIEDIESYFLNV